MNRDARRRRARVLQEGKTVHLPDVLADPEYQALDIQQVVGFRAILGVPLMRAGAPSASSC